jgi:hypothetical protein
VLSQFDQFALLLVGGDMVRLDEGRNRAADMLRPVIRVVDENAAFLAALQHHYLRRRRHHIRKLYRARRR